MSLPEHFRQCMVELDINLARKLWKHIAPNMPQPGNDADVLATMHMARTQMRTIAFKLRAYSHRWCVDNGFPSALPDELKPKAERIYPRIVDGVGIACKAMSPVTAPVLHLVRREMENAVLEAYADRRTEPSFVKGRMMEARAKAKRKLLGI